jgi:hypothetical protein
MEELKIRLNDPKLFDAMCHGADGVRTLPSGDLCSIITKDGGMEFGRACALITFEVEVDGKIARAQYTTSVRLLVATLHVLMGRYGHEGVAQPQN